MLFYKIHKHGSWTPKRTYDIRKLQVFGWTCYSYHSVYLIIITTHPKTYSCHYEFTTSFKNQRKFSKDSVRQIRVWRDRPSKQMPNHITLFLSRLKNQWSWGDGSALGRSCSSKFIKQRENIRYHSGGRVKFWRLKDFVSNSRQEPVKRYIQINRTIKTTCYEW